MVPPDNFDRFIEKHMGSETGIEWLGKIVANVAPSFAEKAVSVGAADVVLSKLADLATTPQDAKKMLTALLTPLRQKLDSSTPQHATLESSLVDVLHSRLLECGGIDGLLRRLSSEDDAERSLACLHLQTTVLAIESEAWKQRLAQLYSDKDELTKLIESLCSARSSSFVETVDAVTKRLAPILGRPFVRGCWNSSAYNVGQVLHELMYDVKQKSLRAEVLDRSTALVNTFGAFVLPDVCAELHNRASPMCHTAAAGAAGSTAIQRAQCRGANARANARVLPPRLLLQASPL